MNIARNRICHDELVRLLSGYQFPPLACFPTIGMAAARTSFSDASLAEIARGSSYYASDEETGRQAVAWCAFQDFDTAQFGCRTESILGLVAESDCECACRLKKDLAEQIEADCRTRGTQYIGHRAAADDTSTVDALVESGFEVLDRLTVFSLTGETRASVDLQGGINVRVFAESDLRALKEIAASSFVYDRFHADPFLDKARADAFHAVWIENLCRGLADVVLVAEQRGTVAGFAACRVDAPLGVRGTAMGTIILIASAREARRRGIGGALMREAVSWLRLHGASEISVGTQAENEPARRTYAGLGFECRATRVFLRKWLGDRQ